MHIYETCFTTFLYFVDRASWYDPYK